MSYVFINKGSEHVDEHGNKHAKGGIVRSTKNLAAMFPNKFVPYREAVAPAAAPVAAKPVVAEAPVAEPTKEAETEELTDVSVHYPAAQNNGLLVFQGSDGFYVYDAGDLETPLNEAGIPKKKLKAFIDQCLKTADAE